MKVLVWSYLRRLRGPLPHLSSISPVVEVAIKAAGVVPPAAPRMLVTPGDLDLEWQALEVQTTSLGKAGRCV